MQHIIISTLQDLIQTYPLLSKYENGLYVEIACHDDSLDLFKAIGANIMFHNDNEDKNRLNKMVKFGSINNGFIHFLKYLSKGNRHVLNNPDDNGLSTAFCDEVHGKNHQY